MNTAGLSGKPETSALANWPVRIYSYQPVFSSDIIPELRRKGRGVVEIDRICLAANVLEK